MEKNNRRDRYRDDDNRSSNYNRNNNYNSRDNYYDRDRNFNNRDRNDEWGTDYRGYNNGNQDMYSSNNERNYWNGRNEYNNDLSTGNRSYNRPDSSYMNSGYDRYRYGNDYYNDRYSNEGWRDTNYNRNSRNDSNEERGWWDKTKDEVSSWFGDDNAERRRRMDEYREGQHRGKGPKNYNRSKERIKEDASDRLSDDSLIDASNIEITVDDNDLTLSGTVETRYEKRRAEDLVENVSGVKNVQNNLRVVSKSMANSGNSGTSSNVTSNSTYSATKNTRESANNLS